ncbi:MAG: aminopeptidase [Clostridia bacterium]|nr:aminopeptidase [Clostridia bacterium]
MCTEKEKNEKEKSQAAQLKEKLAAEKAGGALKLDAETIKLADEFCEGYKAFINTSKVEREAVATTEKIALQHGFEKYDVNKSYKAGDKVYVINRGKNIGLAVIGKNGTKNGVRLVIAHIDSPRLDLKPNPLYEANDLALFKTHYYGGIKKYQWTTIPLALHGRIVRLDGEYIDVCIGENDDEPCFCVSDLLPHLSREQAAKPVSKAFTGEDLNVLIGSRPFNQDKESEQVKLNILNILFEKYGVIESDFLSAELDLVPAFKSRDVGFDRSLIGAYGHDDKVCAYPGVMAAMAVENPESTFITFLCDKEEIGSDGNTGMQSTFLRDFIADLAEADGVKYRHVMAKSTCLSADVNAAFDPNYASAFESSNASYLNGGVIITKYTGSGGKYDTSDASAEFMGQIRRMLHKNNILWQTGELGKVDLGGGGTIAKYIANLNVDVVDLGVPVLSMHAPFEVVSKVDVYMTYLAFKAFLEE